MGDPEAKISCTVPEEKLKDVLANEYNTKKDFLDLLLKQDPEQKTLKDLEEGKPLLSKQDNIETKNIVDLLLRESNTLVPISSEYPQSTNDKYSVEKPKIVDPLESILVQIKINHTRINFLSVQNYLLSQYIQSALQVLDPSIAPLDGETFNATREDTENILKDFLNMYPLFKDITYLRKDKEDPIVDLFESLPCSVHELKFLISILKQYERRL